jgi:hypothetical protein
MVAFRLPVTIRYPARLQWKADFDGRVSGTTGVDGPPGQVEDESATR